MQTRNRDRYHLRNTLDLSRITYLLTAYNGRDLGLFHAAAAESQWFATQLTIEESQCQYNNFVIRLGCGSAEDTLACLRGKSAVELHEQPYPGAEDAPLYMWQPVIDGELIPDYTYRLFE